jgi:exonuclease SbcD
MNETRTFHPSQDPNTIRFIAICDPHLTHLPPAAHKGDYHALVMSALNRVMKFAHENRVDAILWAGDIFHRKTPAQNPLSFISETIRWFKSHPFSHLAIAGNHDLRFGALTNGLEGSPFDLLLASGAIQLLDESDHSFYAEKDQHWEPGELAVQVSGASYHHSQAEPAINKKRHDHVTHMITLGHFWFGPTSGNFWGEAMYGPDKLGQSPTDTWVIGHHHKDQGIHNINGKTYIAPGSVTILGAHEDDLTRRPAVTLIEVTKDGMTTKTLRPTWPPADQILDLTKRDHLKQEKERLDTFTEALAAAHTTAADPEAVLGELNLPTQVRDRALRYLQEAEQA